MEAPTRGGNLITSHIVFDETTGMSATMKAFERDPTEKPKAHTMRAPMMALANPDPVLQFPAGTKLVPHVFLRNSTAVPLRVGASLLWRSPSQSGSLGLPEMTLAPGATRLVSLAAAGVPADAYWATVVLEYKGRRGDLVPVAASFDESGRYGLQTPFSEGVSHLWKGSMWHVDATRNSLITAGNGGTGITHAAVTLFYNKGKDFYTIEKQLQPGEQIWADVGDIIRSEMPDKNGNTIPRDVTMGTYELRDLDHIGVGYLYEGKLVIDKSWGHGYYGCAGCCGYDGQQLLPNPFSDSVGTEGNNTAESEDMCSDSWVDVTSETYDWTSTNSGIVNLASAVSHFMSPGTVTGSGQVQLQRQLARLDCPVQGFEPQNTQNSCSISLTRTNLTQTSASGSPDSLAGDPAFTYSVSGTGTIATYATSDANANPNTATTGGTPNTGAPEPGGLGTLKATYNCETAAVSTSFQVPTFGLSCYYLALESDWGTPPSNCSSVYISIYGETYSGSSTNLSGMPAGTYCNAFLGELRLQGSGSTKAGIKVHYVSGDYPTWTFSVISAFTGADGTALVPNGSVARDRSIVPRNTTVQLPSGSYVANDVGGGITGYRLDVFMGTGVAACSGFQNNVVVAACSPATSTCPGQ
ncbi:MAG: hypothetical protein JO340_12730 [Acidobacteriaceae bacterium]|nr:hypothetical protein [Acidobacteriaceae bacterium]